MTQLPSIPPAAREAAIAVAIAFEPPRFPELDPLQDCDTRNAFDKALVVLAPFFSTPPPANAPQDTNNHDADSLTADISRVIWGLGHRGDDYLGAVKAIRELIASRIPVASQDTTAKGEDCECECTSCEETFMHSEIKFRGGADICPKCGQENVTRAIEPDPDHVAAQDWMRLLAEELTPRADPVPPCAPPCFAPQRNPMNNQTAYLIAEKRPTLPCWLWHGQDRFWSRCRAATSDCFEPRSVWTHWHPDGPEPTLAPDAPTDADLDKLDRVGIGAIPVRAALDAPKEGTTVETVYIHGDPMKDTTITKGYALIQPPQDGAPTPGAMEIAGAYGGAYTAFDVYGCAMAIEKLVTQRLAAAEQKVGRAREIIERRADQRRNMETQIESLQTALTAANSARDGAIKERDEALLADVGMRRQILNQSNEICSLRTQLTSALTRIEELEGRKP